MSIHQTAFIDEHMPWRGFHHIALATADLDATRSFYGEILGMPVSAIFPPREGRGRHCLIYVNHNDNDTWGFHFFERPEAASRAMSLALGEQAGFLLHIALRLPHDSAAHALRERLHQAQVSITDIPALGSFVFNDNNGILLEVTWPKGEAEPS
jgi:catechol 2,3-dioxygenase-like lactoylglutathione lyase family enzyme